MSNADVVRSVYTNFNSHNIDGLLSVVTEDFELVDMALGQSWHGLEGWQEWIGMWASTAPDALTEVTSLITDGDWVFTEHTGRGTQTDPLATPAGTIPPTNRQFELKFGELYQMRNGKIAVMKAYWDSATLMRQLGLM